MVSAIGPPTTDTSAVVAPQAGVAAETVKSAGTVGTALIVTVLAALVLQDVSPELPTVRV